jgi:ATP-dependent Clp protease ATP-binding subunit ClpC
MSRFSFADSTRKALQAAGDEAAALRHEYIGTEHLLLGVLDDPESAAVAVVIKLKGNVAAIRATVLETVKAGTAALPIGMPRPYTSRAKKALDFAVAFARDDGGGLVSPQHVLLGLLREEKGIAAQLLVDAGITLQDVAASVGR